MFKNNVFFLPCVYFAYIFLPLLSFINLFLKVFLFKKHVLLNQSNVDKLKFLLCVAFCPFMIFILWYTLYSPHFIKCVKNLSKETFIVLYLGFEVSEKIIINQGYSLSPHLFNTYILILL